MSKTTEPLPKDINNGDKYGPAMAITDQAEADAYFERCVQHNMAHGHTREEAESVERQNLGYWSGYYDAETMGRVQTLFKCTHPIFGSTIPTPAEAFEMGKQLAAGKDSP